VTSPSDSREREGSCGITAVRRSRRPRCRGARSPGDGTCRRDATSTGGDRRVDHRRREEGAVGRRVVSVGAEERDVVAEPLLREQERATDRREVGVDRSRELHVALADPRLHVDRARCEVLGPVHGGARAAGPGLVEHGARADPIDLAVEAPRVLLELIAVLERGERVTLQHDVGEPSAGERRAGVGLLPVPRQIPARVRDLGRPELGAVRHLLGDPLHHVRQIVEAGVAIADEERVHRRGGGARGSTAMLARQRWGRCDQGERERDERERGECWGATGRRRHGLTPPASLPKCLPFWRRWPEIVKDSRAGRREPRPRRGLRGRRAARVAARILNETDVLRLSPGSWARAREEE
jgi:hypothetical protein